MTEMGGPAESSGKPWWKRPLPIAIAAVVLAIAVWTYVENAAKADRKELGYSLCEDAVADELLTGYSPGLTVVFEEEQPSGDLAYSVFTDDHDGQFTCEISGSGDPEPRVSNGFVYD